MARIKHDEFRRWLQAIESGRPISIKCGNLHFRRDGWIFSYQQWIGYINLEKVLNRTFWVNAGLERTSQTTRCHQRALDVSVNWTVRHSDEQSDHQGTIDGRATQALSLRLTPVRAPSERWVYAANLDAPDW